MNRKGVKSQKTFRSRGFNFARHTFFVLYATSLIAVTGLIQKNFSRPAAGTAENLIPENMTVKMTVLEQNDPYSFTVRLDADGRILTIKKAEIPELIPRRLFPDEELFFLSLEGRRLRDLPEDGDEAGFKARFLGELRRKMEFYESQKIDERTAGGNEKI